MVDGPVFVVAPEIVVWQKNYSLKLSNEISSVTESLKFACRPIFIQGHDLINEVIMSQSSLNVTAAILRKSES